MPKVKAFVTLSFLSGDFFPNESDEEWRARLARLAPQLHGQQPPREQLLTLRSAESGSLKRDLRRAGFTMGEAVIISSEPQSKPLTFEELEVDSYFTDFPTDGDDAGHGGFRRGLYLFRKTRETTAVRISDGNESRFPPTMRVLRVVM